MHELTSSGSYDLEIKIKKGGQTKIVKYTTFSVASESNNYRLSVSGYEQGTSGLGDSLSYHNGKVFSTTDRPNYSDQGCVYSYGRVGWWYGSGCWNCHLNYGESSGPYFSGWQDEATMILKHK